jgi:hypothetical protein
MLSCNIFSILLASTQRKNKMNRVSTLYLGLIKCLCKIYLCTAMNNAYLTRIEPSRKTARTFERCARNLGIAKRAARVRIECVAHAVRPAILRANAHPKLSAYATRAATKRISSTMP